MNPSRLLAFTALIPAALAAQPSLTIYNQSFAVVRDHVPLDLKTGVNEVSFAGVTAQMETDSVVLRDPTGKNALRILEQNYRADVISTGLMLQLNEGKTITFLVRDKDGKETPVQGKIIRSGYVPGLGRGQLNDETPIIEVNGQLRFSLPGEPVFPVLANDAILKPTLTWQLDSAATAKFDAEIGYITNGFTWSASYNLVAPEKGDKADLVGWITINNQSGKTFDNAEIKLMAGDVNKIQPTPAPTGGRGGRGGAVGGGAMAPVVTEKAFDEFHLYSIARPATLRDHETKQVEFVRAEGLTAPSLYIYDGAANLGNYRTITPNNASNPNYGTQTNKKVWVMREFKNTTANQLGLPLPKGRVRFYRQDDADHNLEFVGENNLDHTPKDETVRLYVGDSFDLVGERVQTAINNLSKDVIEESFQIDVRNHKTEPAVIRVVEHLYRAPNWTIVAKSDAFVQNDARTIEFRIPLQPDEAHSVTYTVRYVLPN